MRRVFLSRPSRQDIAEITAFIKRAAGPRTAGEAVHRIHRIVRLLADTPGEIGTARPEIRAGIRSYPVPPYVIFFRYTREEVRVLRILHERRDIETVLTD